MVDSFDVMVPAATEALMLVDRIYRRLNHRRPVVEQRERYFLGDQPLSFATAEWKRENAERYKGFSDNWAAPVVNAESERIKFLGVTIPGNPTGSLLLREQWLANEMEAQSSQGFVTTLTTARSFVIVWGDSDGTPIISWEHPSNVEIEYDFANLRTRRAALNTWVDEENEYATLYTRDFVWKYVRGRALPINDFQSQAKQAESKQTFDGGWQPRAVADEPWPIRNPLGEVPVVEVPNRPPLRGDPISEIAGVIPMQDAINLLWAYLFLSADYASMDARVVLGSAPPMIPILDDNGIKIGEKPVDMKVLRDKRLLYLTDPNAKIDSWKSAELNIFTDTIDVAVGHVASQTRTPPTYLVTKTGMSNVNADGLKASEIGLNQKVVQFQDGSSPAMREVNRLVALVLDDKALADQVKTAKMNWKNPEIRSEAQLADMMVKLRAIGLPLQYLLELYGTDPSDIPRILAMAKEEAAAGIPQGVDTKLIGTAESGGNADDAGGSSAAAA